VSTLLVKLLNIKFHENPFSNSGVVKCRETDGLAYDDDQWRYSPDRALASLTGFMVVCSSTMRGYQLHDRPVQDTLIQPSETSSSNH
jgi:hypothetical protein